MADVIGFGCFGLFWLFWFFVFCFEFWFLMAFGSSDGSGRMTLQVSLGWSGLLPENRWKEI